MPEETPRSPSSPVAGGFRGAVQVLVGLLAARLVAGNVPPEMVTEATFAVTTIVVGVLAAIGKVVREKYPSIPTPV